MKVRIPAIMLIALFTQSAQIDSFCSPKPRYDVSPVSIREAEKLGVLIGPVDAKPKEFIWEQHNVSIRESWLARTRSGKRDLYFTLAVDGDPLKEHQLADRKKLQISFQVENFPRRTVDYFRFLPTRRIPKSLLGGS